MNLERKISMKSLILCYSFDIIQEPLKDFKQACNEVRSSLWYAKEVSTTQMLGMTFPRWDEQ